MLTVVSGGQVNADEGRAVPGARAPRQPTSDEKEAHCRSGHYPRRKWCSVCVQATCVASPHTSTSSSSSSQHDLPIVSVDYCYPGSTKEADAKRYARAKEVAESGGHPEEEAVPEGSRPTIVVHDSQSQCLDK